MKTRIALVALIAIAALAIYLLAATEPANACNQGCTPGFWKQEQHFEHWPTFVCTDPSWHWLKGVEACPLGQRTDLGEPPQDALVTDVFDVACLDDGGRLDLNGDGTADTLLDALNYQGGPGLDGKAQILLRIATADVLNAMTQDHDPALPTIFHVKTALGGFDWNGQHLPGGCDGDLRWMEYWATFLDDRVNSQPCAFDNFSEAEIAW